MFTKEEKEIVKYNIVQLSETLKKYGIRDKTFSELGITHKAYSYMKIRNQNLGKKRIRRLCARFNIDYDIFTKKKLDIKATYLFDIKFENK